MLAKLLVVLANFGFLPIFFFFFTSRSVRGVTYFVNISAKMIFQPVYQRPRWVSFIEWKMLYTVEWSILYVYSMNSSQYRPGRSFSQLSSFYATERWPSMYIQLFIYDYIVYNSLVIMLTSWQLFGKHFKSKENSSQIHRIQYI